MGVRNNEELKNLRQIGIVGVRYREYHFGIEINESYVFTVTEPVALVGDSMWVDYFYLTLRINGFF